MEAARAQLDPRTFRQEFEASFENLSGLVAVNFSDDNISKTVTDIPQLPLWIGLDFNVDNMSAVFGIRVDDELHIFDELIMTNATTWDVADEINHRFTLERKKTSAPTPPAPPAKPPASASPTTPSSANPASKSPPHAPPGKSATKSTASTPPSSIPLERAASKSTPAAAKQLNPSEPSSTTTTASPTKNSASTTVLTLWVTYA